MHVRKTLSFSRSILFPLGLAVAVILGAVTPAAASDQEYEGFYVALDLALTQPNSLDHNLISFGDFNGPGGSAQTNRFSLDNDDDFTWALDLGWGWGDMGSLHVSYWTFDNDDAVDGTFTYYAFPSVFGIGYGYYGYGSYVGGPGTFSLATDVEATTTDIDYIRPVSIGDKFAINWLVGIRMAEYDETQSVLTTGALVGPFLETKTIEADAFGFRFGATAVMGIGENFAIEGGMAISFLQAETEGVAQKTVGFGGTEFKFAEDDNVRGEIREYHVRAVWSAGPVDCYLGYQVADWDGLVVDPLPAFGDDIIFEGPTNRGRESISFNSVSGGIRWAFGRD